MYGKYALEVKFEEKKSIFTIKSGFYVLFIGTVVPSNNYRVICYACLRIFRMRYNIR